MLANCLEEGETIERNGKADVPAIREVLNPCIDPIDDDILLGKVFEVVPVELVRKNVGIIIWLGVGTIECPALLPVLIHPTKTVNNAEMI